MKEKRGQKKKEDNWVFWLALFLIIIGVAAVVMLALRALRII